MNILLLCEGDAETEDAWSGIPVRLVKELRRRGHSVVCGDTDLYGIKRWLGAAASFSLSRRRWWVRYHLTGVPFHLRSRRAGSIVRSHGDEADVILQIGATFYPRERGDTPLFLYCDSNIELAARGQDTGYSEASVLRPRELEAVRAREKFVYDRADGILAMSNRLQYSFVNDFELPSDRIRTVHAGPNFSLDQIPYPPPVREHRPPTILFVGKQFHRKGGDLLLAAFEKVRARHPNARLVIAGPQQLKIDSEGVVVLGFLDKESEEGWETLVRAYREADVFCLPTRFEPFGVAFLEAMCFGLPCVGPDRWAVPEIIQDGKTGLLVPPENENRLAESLSHLLEEPDKARSMGKAGRERVMKHFTWQAATDRIVDAIGDLNS